MAKVAVHVKLQAVEGKGDELVQAFLSLYDGPLDTEPGTETHVIHQAKDDADAVYFYEVYSDEESFKAHGSGEPLKSVLPKLAGLVAGRPETVVLVPKAAKGLAL